MKGQILRPPGKRPLPGAPWLKAVALILLALSLVLAANLQAQEADSSPAKPPPPPPGSQGNMDSYLNLPIPRGRQPREIPSKPPPDPGDAPPPMEQNETSSAEADYFAHVAGDRIDAGNRVEKEANSAREIDSRAQTVTAVPAAPTLQSPHGTTDHNTPYYNWSYVAGAGWYYLWVNDATNTPFFQQWYQADGICGEGLCRVWPSLELPDGDYVWWVAGWNSEGTGEWSASMSFTVINSPPPDTQQLSPVYSTHESMPTFEWRLIPASSWYWLWINDAEGDIVHEAWYRVHTDLDCDLPRAKCSVTPKVELVPGDYAWWVKTWNSAGYGPWTDGVPLLYDPRPFKAQPRYPLNTRPCASIMYFEWIAEPATSWYLLHVERIDRTPVFDQWYRAEEVCQGSACSTPYHDLPNGNYHWWVQTWNSYGYGPLSGTEFFTMDSTCGFNSQFLTSADGWQEHAGDWNISGGDWYAVDGLANASASASYNATYQDYRYNVRLWREGGDSDTTGIYIRGTPEPLAANGLWNSGYHFLILRNADGPQYSIWEIGSGVALALQGWTTTDAFTDINAWNTLLVQAYGGNLYFYINNTMVWQGYDATISSGRAGITMYSDGIGDDRLWVDWAHQEDRSADPFLITGSISERQQAWNEEANANPRGNIERAPSPAD